MLSHLVYHKRIDLEGRGEHKLLNILYVSLSQCVLNIVHFISAFSIFFTKRWTSSSSMNDPQSSFSNVKKICDFDGMSFSESVSVPVLLTSSFVSLLLWFSDAALLWTTSVLVIYEFCDLSTSTESAVEFTLCVGVGVFTLLASIPVWFHCALTRSCCTLTSSSSCYALVCSCSCLMKISTSCLNVSISINCSTS